MDFMKRVETLRPTLRAIARRLDGRYTAFNDDDLCQEALLAWWVKYGQGELDDKTDSFLLQGGYFAMRNFIRSNHRRVEQSSVSLNAPLNESGETLEDRLEDAKSAAADECADHAALAAAMRDGLSARETTVFELRGSGLTTREAGRRLGISHVMVVKIEKRIRDKCRHRQAAARKK